MEVRMMSYTKLKPKKMSMFDFTQTYANDLMKCVEFFINMKWPDGFACDRCDCHEYWIIKRQGKTKTTYILECKECHKQYSLLSGTIFEKCHLDLYKLLLGIFLFFNVSKGISATTLRSHLDVNIKTAQLLATKCRILMSLSNAKRLLDSPFYESDVCFIGSPTKGKPGRSTEKQPVLAILSTQQDNNYPMYLKARMISNERGETLKENVEKNCILSQDRTLNTDGDKGFNSLKEKIKVKNEVVDYNQPNHRLKWLNIIIGNLKNNITGIYHGVGKREMPLFLNEQEYRFNHRYTGKEMFNKVKEYLQISFPITHKQIVNVLDQTYIQLILAC